MPGVQVRITTDLGGMLAALDSAEAGAALELLTLTVEEDMRPYVKKDTGKLEGSAQKSSDFARGRIVYTAEDARGREYAGYAYDDPNVGKHDGQNRKAAAQWAEVSAADRMGEWERAMAAALEEEMR